MNDEFLGFTNFSVGIMVNDLNTGKNRPSTKQDVVETARAMNYVRVRPVVVAVEPRECQVASMAHALEAALTNTAKHVLVPASAKEDVEAAVAMAAAITGGEDALRERPLVSFSPSPVSPLLLVRGFTDPALAAVRAGMPCFAVPCSMAGATAPQTLAGSIVQTNAEALACLALLQLAEPGAKVIYGTSSNGMDLRVGGCAVGTPETSLISAGVAQLVRHYGLPSFIHGL